MSHSSGQKPQYSEMRSRIQKSAAGAIRAAVSGQALKPSKSMAAKVLKSTKPKGSSK